MKVKPKQKVWIVFDDQTKFGEGRAQLLELIDDLGSIRKAVARLGMSYRNAWGYLRALEQAAGFKFLERTAGGGARGGTRLTKPGRAFLVRYRRLKRGVDHALGRHFERTFKGG